MSKIRDKIKPTRQINFCFSSAKFYNLSAMLAISFLLAFSMSNVFSFTSNTSAISIDPSSSSTISGSSTSPVSVSVSNSPLSYYISVSSSHGSAGTPVSLSYSQDGSTGGTLGNVVSSSDNV
ncbi:hypothetical protein IJJ36_01690, partial [Candidatus Saccharibacteria bacterium]|nr:hypothetical protein [Candidatus Saccharibacteria bacterium]